MNIPVLLVDDDAAVREALAQTLPLFHFRKPKHSKKHL